MTRSYVGGMVNGVIFFAGGIFCIASEAAGGAASTMPSSFFLSWALPYVFPPFITTLVSIAACGPKLDREWGSLYAWRLWGCRVWVTMGI